MPKSNKCPSCGATVLDGLPGSLCAPCISQAGLSIGDAEQIEAARRSTIHLSLPPLGANPSDRIGRYKLLQQIGEGGCGVVYMAEQEEPIKRRVALKVIKPGMDTKEVLGRFEAERQALALMDHSNIAKVFDAGATEAGRPFFVMELVQGIPITRYCDENKLNTQQRLELFIQVCRAIQHAHQKGIIHRDIKPSNILVADHDGMPTPKIIDFGIAKATAGQTLTNKTVFTALEQFIGTPAYMSPEQAKLSGLDIDTRSDIYSLGVLLYELLTGKTPFESKRLFEAGLDEIRRIIREEEPPRPSQKLSTLTIKEQTTTARCRQTDSPRLLHLVRGDLDWIVMKCLEKDRTRRYETANGLAADLMRHLGNEPVIARPPSNVYRLRKMVRRHRIAFAAGAAVAVALLAGLGVATQLFAQNARAKTARAQTARKLLSNMLSGLAPTLAQAGSVAMLTNVLERVANQVDRDLRDYAEERADLQDQLGQFYFNLQVYDKAEVIQRAAIASRKAAVGAEHPKLAMELKQLGTTLWKENRPKDAEQLLREALAMRRKLLGEESFEVAESMNDLSMLLYEKGSLDEAESLQQKALTMSRKLGGENDPRVSISLNNLATILLGLGKFAAAEKLQLDDLARSRRLPGTNDQEVAISLNNLALLLSDEGKNEEAEKYAQEALTLRRKTLPKDDLDLAQSLDVVAQVLTDEKKPAKAEPLLQEALEIRRTSMGPRYLDVAISLDRLAKVYERENRLLEAEQLLRESLAIREQTAKDDPFTYSTRSILGGVLAAEKKFDEAEQFLVSGYEGMKRLDSTDSHAEKPDLQRPLERLVKFCKDTAQPEKAATWQQQLDALLKKEENAKNAEPSEKQK